MPFPELNTWGAEAGLSRKELIRIQPYYPHALTADEVELYRLINLGAEYVLMLMAAGGINLIISAVNTINLIRKRRGWLGPMLGVVAGGSLMVLVIFALQLLGAGNRLAEPLAGRWWVSDDPAPYWNIVSTYLTFLAGPAFGVGLVSVTLSLWTRFRTKVEAWLQTGNL
jgi:hypothetical protein